LLSCFRTYFSNTKQGSVRVTTVQRPVSKLALRDIGSMRTRLNSRGGSTDDVDVATSNGTGKEEGLLTTLGWSVRSRIRRTKGKVKNLMKEEIQRGLEPRVLSLSVATGVTFGIFPVFFTAAIICSFVDLAARLAGRPLSTLVVQSVALAAGPVQVFLCIPFLHAGEYVSATPPTPLSPGRLYAMLREDPWHVHNILAHAALGWALFAPVIYGVVYHIVKRNLQLHFSGSASAPTPTRTSPSIKSKAALATIASSSLLCEEP